MSHTEGGGGAFALPSPTHVHQMDVTSAVRSLRRSISRSPSRFLSRTTSRNSHGSIPASPQSPCRRFRLTPHNRQYDQSPSTHAQTAPPAAPFVNKSGSLQSPSLTPLRTKLSLRSVKSARTASPSRQIARARASPKSPLRRALNSTSEQGNAAAQQATALFLATAGFPTDQENNKLPTSPIQTQRPSGDKPSRHSLHLDVSGASETAFLKALDAKNDSVPSSTGGLKRNDAMMNLDQPYQGSPVPKRRSMHGASSYEQSVERGIFGSTPIATTSFKIHEDTNREPGTTSIISEAPRETQASPSTSFLPPPRRSSSLRKSTMLSRPSDKGSWGRRAGQRQLAQMDTDGVSTPSKPRAPVTANQFDPPTARGGLFGSTTPSSSPNFHVQEARGAQGHHHPLSQIHTLSASSSGDSLTEGRSSYAPAPPPNRVGAPAFSRSLPPGAERPTGVYSGLGEATPNHVNLMHRGIVGSTGLVSKVNRNPEQEKRMAPPDTPCKPWRKPSDDRFNTYPIGGTPSSAKKSRGNNRNSFAGISSLTFQPPSEGPRRGHDIFNLRQSVARDFGHYDDDGDAGFFDEMIKDERLSTNMHPPPTPTRNGLTPSFSKLSNLSEQSEQGSDESLDSPSANRKSFGPRDGLPISAVRPVPLRQPNFGSVSPVGARQSPRNPQELPLFENPSQLSTSRPSVVGGFGDSIGLPPATPTSERDFRSSVRLFSTPVHDDSRFSDIDIEPDLQRKFDDVTKIGDGEFSHVYRVKEHSRRPGSPRSTTPITEQDPCQTLVRDRVSVVKRTKHPYRGKADRARKLKEALILEALKDAEHIVQYLGHWEENDHLYIQTEFCENGSLKDFYSREGFYGRLDDFCIFKILLDLTLGLKEMHDAGFMHLDIKPANIFVTFEGALKIGDFGLARSLSDTGYLDTEGDREYMAPEMLNGKFGPSSDIFSLGMVVFEAIANVEIPGNGEDWRKLRSGDFSGVPSLAWTASCETNPHRSGFYNEEFESNRTHDARDLFGSHKRSELLQPPAFMEDVTNPESLRSMVSWMMSSDMDARPTAGQLLSLGSLQWIAQRRKAPATIFEGRWGPIESESPAAVEVVDTEMTDV